MVTCGWVVLCFVFGWLVLIVIGVLGWLPTGIGLLLWCCVFWCFIVVFDLLGVCD